MYEVWITQGQGGCLIAKRKTLRGALRFVEKHKETGSFAIKYPTGEYHQWD